MRNQNREHKMKPERAAQHERHKEEARTKLKKFDYIEERHHKGMTIRDAVLCKGCGEPLVTTVELEDLQETRREKQHTITTKYRTQAATPAYHAITIELDDGSRLETPVCKKCAQNPELDLQAILTADLERLRQQGMNIESWINKKAVRIVGGTR
jgi:hypothetical protein